MTTKKHHDHPHLSGEHRWGDAGQLILFFLFLAIWITDTFILKYSTFLTESVPLYIRIPIAALTGIAGIWLARGGMKQVFGTDRDKPGVIREGVFRIVRHPIYLGALLFYLTAIILSLSLISGAFWILIIVFYILISKYEEKILTKEFGKDYIDYKKSVGMLFPKI